jgi:hypothetical protein
MEASRCFLVLEVKCIQGDVCRQEAPADHEYRTGRGGVYAVTLVDVNVNNIQVTTITFYPRQRLLQVSHCFHSIKLLP